MLYMYIHVHVGIQELQFFGEMVCVWGGGGGGEVTQ